MPCVRLARIIGAVTSFFPLPVFPAIRNRYFRLSVTVCPSPLFGIAWYGRPRRSIRRPVAPLRLLPPARLVWLSFCLLVGFVRVFVCLPFLVGLFVCLFDPFGFAPKPDKFPMIGTPTCSSRRRRRAKSRRTSACAGAAPLHGYSRVLTGTLGVLFVRVHGGYLAGFGRGPI